MEAVNNKLNPELEENKGDNIEKYKDVDPDKNALELNIFQVAHLHRILQGTSFRFQTEENVKGKLEKLKKDLTKQKSIKSVYNDSVSSFSDSAPMKKSVPKPKKQTSNSAKSTTSIPANMKKCLKNLDEAKKDTRRKLPNIYSEIDFQSLEDSIKEQQLSTPEEFEVTTKQIFSIVLRKYENVSSIHKTLTGIMNLCIGKVEEPQKPPIQQSVMNKLPSIQSAEAILESNKQTPQPAVQQNLPAVNSNSMIPNNLQSCTSFSTAAQNDYNDDKPKQLSKEEKKALGVKIRRLNQKYMKGIIKIVSNEHQLK